MRRPILIAVFVCAASAAALAQGPEDRLEVAGGYSWTSLDPRSVSDVVTAEIGFPAGWVAAVTVFLASDAGLSVEFGGHYGAQNLGLGIGEVDATVRTFLVGGKFVERFGRWEIPARVMGGVTRTTVDSAARRYTDSSVTIAAGAGLDMLFGHVGLRLVQFDLMFAPASKSNPALGVAMGAFYRW